MRPLIRLAVALLLALSGGLAACGDDAEPDVSQDDRDGQDQPGDGGSGDNSGDDDSDDPDDDSDDEPTEVDLPPEAEPYAEALTASFTADPSTPIPAESARCASTRTVEIVGIERIQAAGLTPEQFADDADFAALGLDLDDGFAVYDTLARCGIDWHSLVIDSFAAGADDPDAVRACLDAALDEDELREFTARAFIEGDDTEQSPEAEAFFGSLFACTLPGEG